MWWLYLRELFFHESLHIIKIYELFIFSINIQQGSFGEMNIFTTVEI